MAFTGGGVLHGSGTNCTGAVGLEISAGAATWGTVASAEMWAGLLQNVNVRKLFNIFSHHGINNDRTIADAQEEIGNWVEGTLTMDVDCGVPLAMGFGYMSATDDPTLAIWRGASHGSPAEVYPAPWSIKLEYDESTDDNISVLGAMINTATYSMDLDGPLKATIDFIGKKAGTDAITSVTNPANSFGSWNTSIKVHEGGTSYTEASGVRITGLKNISFTINYNLRKRTEWCSKMYMGADDNGSDDNATSMQDTSTNFADALVGGLIYNQTDGSVGTITSITTTTNTNDTVNFSGNLSGGTDNDFDDGDVYLVQANKPIRQPTAGVADLELRMTRGFIDDDFWDDICDGSVMSFRIKPAIATGTPSSLTIDLQSCFCKEVSHNVNLDDQSEDVAIFSVKDATCAVVDGVTYVIWGD